MFQTESDENFKHFHLIQNDLRQQHWHSGSDTAEQYLSLLKFDFFYRSNLIFWNIMGGGIAQFGERGLEGT